MVKGLLKGNRQSGYASKLKWWQWETLLVTMGGYALYYVIRKNLLIAMPLLAALQRPSRREFLA